MPSSGKNSTKLYSSKKRLVLVATLLGLFNLALVLVAILPLLMCVWYGRMRGRSQDPSSPSAMTHTPADQGMTGGTGGEESEPCPLDNTSEDRISMMANILYGLRVCPQGPGCELGRQGSELGGAGCEMGGDADGEALRMETPLSTIESMVYNRMYGSYTKNHSPAHSSSHHNTGSDRTQNTYSHVYD